MEHFEGKKLWLSILFALIVPGILWFSVYELSYKAIDRFEHPKIECFTYTPSYPPKIPAYTWKGTGLITIWFDDAWLSTYTHAAPIMEEYGYSGALSVFISAVCTPNFMTWNQIHELQSNGWEISAHSYSHNPNIGYYNQAAIYKELVLAKKVLREHGLRSDQFVMPYGFSSWYFKNYFFEENPAFLEGVKKYYTAFRGSQDQWENVLPVTDPYNLDSFTIRKSIKIENIKSLIKQAAEKKQWLILVFHQIGEKEEPHAQQYTAEQNFDVPVEKFKEILDAISESKLPVVLPSQALEAGKIKKPNSSIDSKNAYTNLHF